MRTNHFSLAVLALALATSAEAQQQPGGGGGQARPPFQMTSSAFTDGGWIPVKFSQAAEGAAPGEGTSPALFWANAPAGTQSFVLHMHDMEVARNKGTEDQAHWLVWDIPGNSTGLAEGLPRGSKMADGSFQISATGPVYRGPGAGAAGLPHHYTFELYALDAKLNVQPSEDAFETRTRVMAALQGHVLGKAVLMGFFQAPELTIDYHYFL